jgi:hypothetical protein
MLNRVPRTDHPGQCCSRPSGFGRYVPWYTFRMTKRLEDVVADVQELTEEEQDRVAEAVLTFLRELQDDTWRVA